MSESQFTDQPTVVLSQQTPTYPGPQKVFRNPHRGVVGGVAAGLGEYLGIAPTKVRIVLGALCVVGFAGAIVYGLSWLFIPARPEGVAPPRDAERVALGTDSELRAEQRTGRMLVFAGIVAALLGGFTVTANIFAVAVPLIVVALGAGLVWRELDFAGAGDGDAERPLAALAGDRFALLRIAAGVALVVVGLAIAVFREIDVAQFGTALVVIVAALAGIALLTVPLWMRMLRTVEAERAAAVREKERANIASHLHDSVLQTLALIQKRADDPAQVTTLARRQERELRQWLFAAGERSRNDPDSVAAAVERIAEEIEDTYELQVSQVVVGGDAPLGENEAAAVAAARECLVNVAKHAGVDRADVFCEIYPMDDEAALEIFVRDRGRGFLPEEVPEDRKGLALSVRERVENHGGTARVRSRLGSGTEVAIRVPRTASDGTDSDR